MSANCFWLLISGGAVSSVLSDQTSSNEGTVGSPNSQMVVELGMSVYSLLQSDDV